MMARQYASQWTVCAIGDDGAYRATCGTIRPHNRLFVAHTDHGDRLGLFTSRANATKALLVWWEHDNGTQPHLPQTHTQPTLVW